MLTKTYILRWKAGQGLGQQGLGDSNLPDQASTHISVKRWLQHTSKEEQWREFSPHYLPT